MVGNRPLKTDLSLFCAVLGRTGLFSGRDYFDPITIRVGYKVNAHVRIIHADAAHFLMQGVCHFHVIGNKSKVKLLLAKMVRLGAIGHICKLKPEIGHAVA